MKENDHEVDITINAFLTRHCDKDSIQLDDIAAFTGSHSQGTRPGHPPHAMDPQTPTLSSLEDDAEPSHKQHEYHFSLDLDIQKTLLDDVETDPQPSAYVPIGGGPCDHDIHPWNSGPGRRTSDTSTATSAYHRPREPRVNLVTRNTANRPKEIPFSFRHYANPARYMEQYRRDYTYANLDTSMVGEIQFPVCLPPNANRRLLQTTPCQTGRTENYANHHTASSIGFQDNRMELATRPMRYSTSVDTLSRSLRNPTDFESHTTSGPSSTNKFWTFDANHVLPVMMNTGIIRRTRALGATAGEMVASSAAFSRKEAKHFPGNGYPMDDQSV